MSDVVGKVEYPPFAAYTDTIAEGCLNYSHSNFRSIDPSVMLPQAHNLANAELGSN